MLRKSLPFVRALVLSLALILSILPVGLAPGVALAQSAGTNVSGDVSGTWSLSGSPYLVGGDLRVPAGQTLTVEAGVQVLFQSWYRLEVNGTLLAQGTAAEPILFTSQNSSPGWLGIRFVNADSGSLLEYVFVENGRASGAAPDDAGGGIYVENSSPTIRNSTIRNNYAKHYGGGLYLKSSNAVLSNNLITGNEVGYGSASGGAIYLSSSDVELTNNVIRGNVVASSGGFSTASGYGGAISAYNSAPTLRGNVLADNAITGSNSHKRGGAIYLSNSDAVLVNNTITGNSAGTTAGSQIFLAGGAIFNYESDPVLVNNILWNDTPDELHGSRTGLVGSFAVAYSDVQGGQAGIGNEGYTTVNWLEGNLDADPLFVDAALGDWTLQSGSPAIDAGTAYYEWNGQVVVDLAPGDYDGAAPDMGVLNVGASSPLPNEPPTAVAAADPTSGSAPLDVQFSSDGSSDPEGAIVSYAWDFGDGSVGSSEPNPVHTYQAVGTYQATLTVTDDGGASHSDSVSIEAQTGTTIPAGSVSGTWPATGSPYRIDGDVLVPAGQTLSIEPGVTVLFNSWYRLEINGTLLAQGTAAEPILFTGSSPSPGWLGIRFVNADSSSLLEYVVVENGRASGAAPDDAGGGIYVENSSPAIRNSTIRNNYAKRYGGGLYLSGSNAVLDNNLIIDNVVGYGSASGGAIYLDNADVTLTGNVIRGNQVASSGGFSTASGYGGAIAAHNSTPVLRRNVLADNAITGTNSHKRGGALYLSNSDAVLVNNAITGNSAGTTAGSQIVLAGGAIYNYESEPVLVNNIVWNDTPDELHGYGSVLSTSFTIAYSDVQGGQAGIVLEGNTTVNWQEGNLDADPLFADAALGDWTLQAGSPAIDAGTAYYAWNGQVLVDLAPGEYEGAAPDMGALEAAGGNPLPNQPPLAVASADPTGGDAPLTVQFSAAGAADPDGTIVSYAWDFGDGSASAEANPTYTYNAAGTYQATLTVTDDDGATASDSVTIAVAGANQPPVAVVSALNPSGSVPLTVQFSSDGSFDPDGSIVAYAWDFGDGGTSAEAHPTYTYDTAGFYQATLTVTDDDGATGSGSVDIAVLSPNQPPVAVAAASPTSGSAPLAVQFSADASADPDGIIVSYAWDLGDGSTSFEANPAHTYDAAGTYQATLTVTDNAGATDSDSVAISVSDGNQNRVHIDSQAVERKSRRGRWFALDKIVVVDQNGQPVANALVTARFYGPTEGQASRTTNGSGKVILASSATTDPQGTWCFEILSIEVDGYVYDAGANVVTVQCEG